VTVVRVNIAASRGVYLLISRVGGRRMLTFERAITNNKRYTTDRPVR